MASTLLPAATAALHVPAIPDAAHDLAVARVLGGSGGLFRALDPFAGAIFAWLPLGTRAFRAGLASAALAGLGSALVYALARRLIEDREPGARFASASAAVVALAVALSPGWLLEGAAVGGSVLGAVLALLPLALVARAASHEGEPRVAHLALALDLAATYEPLVALAALLSTSAALLVARAARPSGWRDALRLALPGSACLVGAFPPLYALLRGTDPRLFLAHSAFAVPLGEAGAAARTPLAQLFAGDLGLAVLVLAAAGAVMLARSSRTRPLAAGLVVVAISGASGAAAGAPFGPSRWAGSTLAAEAALAALAGAAVQASVGFVARAKIPLARLSAGMLVVLLLAAPARACDDSTVRLAARNRGGASAWDDAVWGAIPERAVALVHDGRLLERVVAARASGAMGAEEIVVVPVRELGGPMALYEIAREPRLKPFLRDMSLVGVPEELSLSSLAEARPLVMTFDPKWERTLAKHLVPAGMLARFEIEPRGASDRRAALDVALGFRARFQRLATEPCDPDLCAAAAGLLRSRAVAFAAAGDVDLVGRALDELRPFAKDDRVASELSRRVVVGKLPLEVKDLAP